MPTLVREDARFQLDAAQARAIADQFGTPMYVVDETHFRNRIRAYRGALRAASPSGEISFASKANSTLALLRIAFDEGCFLDVASEGELRAAQAAGVPASACHLHGNNKQRGEIEYAVSQGVGHIVADHFGEIEMLGEIDSNLPPIVLRLAPGVDPKTHAKISTGQADTKFGFNIADGSAERAVRRCLELDLPLRGFHCHVGSQLLDPEAQRSGGELIARFAADMLERTGFAATYLNVGGGLGVRYTDQDVPMELAEYNALVVDAVRQGLEGTGLDPVIGQEPGRSLIAESGVTLYRIGVRKTVPIVGGERTYLAVDGGLSDNPRPALYGSKYTVLAVPREGWTYSTDGPGAVEAAIDETFTISGKHCETDRLFEDVVLPSDIGPGDLVQVLCTGAYNSSMASNYNRYPRPGTVLVRADGRFELVQRPDAWEELWARESVPSDL